MARIFVVEDDASLREELMRLLELQGHTALDRHRLRPHRGRCFGRLPPDCVILDLKLTRHGRPYGLPRFSGVSSQVPVIMLTSVRQRVRRGSES